MRRRQLLLLLATNMMGPRAVRAQQKAIPVVGWLSGTSPGPAAPYVAAFRQGLDETGYVEGQNLSIEYRFSEGRYDRLPDLAADLAGRKVDVILAAGDGPALAAKNATSTIPIVHPFPVSLTVYDQTIRVLKTAVAKARLGREEELAALKRIDE